MKMKGWLLAIVAVMVVVAMVFGCAAPAPTAEEEEEITPAEEEEEEVTPTEPEVEKGKWKIKMQEYHEAGPCLDGARVFAERLNILTRGEIEVEFFVGVPLAGYGEYLSAVGQGIFQIGTMWPGFTAAQMPILEITSGAPGILYKSTPEEWWAFVYTTGFEELVNQEYHSFNVHMPYSYAHLGAILMSNIEVTEAEDFEGLQFGAIGIIFLEEALAQMGAGMVPVGGGDIYTGFATGLIDASLWSHAATDYKMGWHEVSKYWHYPPLLPQNVEDIMVNLDFWNSLPPEYQGLIELLSVEWGNAYTYRGYYEAVVAQQLVVDEYGVETPTFSDELNVRLTELSMANILDALATETNAAAIAGWNLYLDFLEEMGY